jgi:hypothetical protein
MLQEINPTNNDKLDVPDEHHRMQTLKHSFIKAELISKMRVDRVQ